MDRSQSIGASDAPAILGLSPWQDAEGLLREKLGLGAPRNETAAMAAGSRAEPWLLDVAAAVLECELLPSRSFQDREFPFLTANPDGWTGTPEMVDVVVEAKLTTVTEGWGEPATDQVPRHYAAQVQHQIAVCRARVGYIVVGFIEPEDRRTILALPERELADAVADLEPVLYELPPDPDWIEQIRQAEVAWWARYQKERARLAEARQEMEEPKP